MLYLSQQPLLGFVITKPASQDIESSQFQLSFSVLKTVPGVPSEIGLYHLVLENNQEKNGNSFCVLSGLWSSL